MASNIQNNDIFGNPLFEKGPVVIFLWKNDSKWHVENVTQNISNMLGYSTKDFKSSTITYSEIVHKDDLARVVSEVENALQNNMDTFTHKPYRVTTKDGNIKWLLDNTSVIKDEHNRITHYLGYITDITEQTNIAKHAETELSSALSRFRDIFNISQVGLSLLDREGKIVEANDKALEMFHLKRDETIKQDYAVKLVKAIKPDGTPMTPDDYAGMKALKTKKPANNVEFGMRNENGNTTWILANAVPLDNGERGVIVSYTDITYKKELENALKKINENLNTLVETELQKRLISEIKLQKIFESISVGVTILDEDGNYVDFNDAYAHIYGYRKNELKGKNFALILQNSDLEQTRKHHYDFMNSDTHDERFYFQARKKDGQLVDIFGTSSKTVMDGKKYKITTIMDVTEQKRQEKLLIEQSRLAEMGEMIGVIAHQWRQPLNAIAIIIQDIKVASEYGEINHELIQKAVKNSMDILHFMSKTIDDFRGFFRKDKEKTLFDACECIENVIRMIKPQLKANDIDVSIECEYDNIIIYGYQNEFKQAVLNILSNSKDAILEKRIDKPNSKGDIAVSISRDDKLTTIQIKDNGMGIKAENMSKIFEPYFSTKSVSGTGIGLYMTKTIIEKNMGGDIDASNYDDGAVITIKLPSCDNQTN